MSPRYYNVENKFLDRFLQKFKMLLADLNIRTPALAVSAPKRFVTCQLFMRANRKSG